MAGYHSGRSPSQTSFDENGLCSAEADPGPATDQKRYRRTALLSRYRRCRRISVGSHWIGSAGAG